MKEKFIGKLLATGRENIDKVAKNLESLGFFEAPASTRFHLCTQGGLAEHSLNVLDAALMLRKGLVEMNPSLAERLPEESVTIAALLHDVCKAEIYKQTLRNVKNAVTGVWEKVPAYETDYSHFPAGHGEKSVIRLLTWGLKLSKDEILAIRWHMNAWELPMQSPEAMGNLSAARNQCPLLTLLQCADMIASGIIEA